jgi:hypothetical protein
MPRNSFESARSFCASFGFLVAVSIFATMGFAQQPSTETKVRIPEDPKQLMLLASQSNGLSGDGVKPWQLKAGFTLYDSNGKTVDQGTIEISWASDHEYKVVYSGASSSQIHFGTKNGTLVSGKANPPMVVAWITNEFIWPTLPTKTLETLKFERVDVVADGAKLVCLNLEDPQHVTAGRFASPTYCLDPNSPVLRLGTHEGDPHVFLRNNIFSFQSRYVPRDITAVTAHRTDLKVHVESLEILSEINDADFKPPSDALPAAR